MISSYMQEQGGAADSRANPHNLELKLAHHADLDYVNSY